MTNLKLMLIEHWYAIGRTDSDLAKAVGIDSSLISRYINGNREPPFKRKLLICKALRIDSRIVFPEDSKSKDE